MMNKYIFNALLTIIFLAGVLLLTQCSTQQEKESIDAILKQEEDVQ